MTRRALIRLALVCMTVLAIQRAEASSAVAIDPQGHLTRAYDSMATEEEARRKGLDLAVPHGWPDARILASSGRFGYCAIALSYRKDGRRALIGVSLGQRSQADANRMAISQCLKAGGYEPRVYARFKG